MAQLLPLTFDDPAAAQAAVEDQSITYGRSWSLHLGDRCPCRLPYPHLSVFGGRAQQVTGLDTLVQWIRITLSLERFKFPIYSDDFGVEFEALVGRSPTSEEVETEAPRMIREALGQDPRILEVLLVEVRPSDEDPTSYFVDMEVVTFTGDLTTISLLAQLEA